MKLKATRITDQQIARAKELHKQDFVCKKIGEMIGVPYTTTYQALHPKSREHHRIHQREYYWEHRKERLLYYYEHKEERRLYKIKYRREHKEEKRLYDAKYHQEHKEKECLCSAKYRREHRGEYNAHNNARYALMLGATIGNLVEIKKIYKRAKDDSKVRCYLCGRLIPKGRRHVDHIVPLSKGGKHMVSNLAIACNSCNVRKHNKMPSEIGILL